MKQTKSSNQVLLKLGIIALLAAVLAVITINAGVFAFADGEPKENTFMSGVVQYVGGIGGALVGIFLIVSIVKDGIAFAKGGGQVSPFKIVGKVLFLILMIGLIYLAINYNSLGKTAQGIGNNVVNEVNNQVNIIDLGGGSGDVPQGGGK